MAEILTIGESLGLFYTAGTGRLSQVGNTQVSIGGAESNFAIGSSRLGARVAWLGKVGKDSLGTRIIRELQAEGVEVHARFADNAATALMLKENPLADQTVVWYYRKGSAGSELRPEDLDEKLIAEAKVLHLGGITLAISESARETVFRAIELAKQNGVLVSFDINYRAKLWSKEEAKPILAAAIAQADIVFAGEEEARILVDGSDANELARNLEKLGPKQVLIKQGENGVTAIIDSKLWQQQAIKVTVVDSVGAGDAFVAGYLTELTSGSPIDKCLLTAVQAGGLACTGPGDWESMPFRAELNQLGNSEPVSR